ncbi:MAG: dephospho-CoA kinase [Candidatus Omnitrophica bacterium]|nr:dephospho-CoA kinase [Candidatus Omnitrophota bacterium]
MKVRGMRSLRDITPKAIHPDRWALGLTGNPGSGKSTAARMMEALGAQVVDADAVGHQLLEADSPVYDALAEEFGSEAASPEGRIDRKALGSIVFRSPERLRRLNEIVHPVLVERLKEAMRRFRSSQQGGVLVVDAALIYEWGIQDWFDAVLVVTAPKEKREQRLLASGRFTAEDFRRRDAAQLAEADKARQADVVFHNDADLEDLRRQIEQFIKN